MPCFPKEMGMLTNEDFESFENPKDSRGEGRGKGEEGGE